MALMGEVNGSTEQRPSPSSLTTLPEILAALSSLDEEESALSKSLTSLVSDNTRIESSLSNLRSLHSQLDELQSEAEYLETNVSTTAKTARRVGDRVRLLDEEMRRVREAAERVGQVMELKSSLSDLQASVDSEDWETAARVCARAMSLPLNVIAGAFSESAVPTADQPLPPAQALQNLRELLRDVFLRQFEQASRARDAASATRFFKLFPPIGWEQEGLQAYATFVVDLIQTRAPPSTKTSSPLYFVTALTAVFESVCSIVDQHQPVVDKYYGSGKMQVVAKRLVTESGKAAQRLLDGWEEERSMKRKLSEISVSTPIISRKQTSQTGISEEDSIDPREIDKVLTEMSGMVMRYSAFRRFLYNSLLETIDEGGINVGMDQERRKSLADKHPLKKDEEAITNLIEDSDCRNLFDGLISKYYVPMEIWYLRSIISQAHKTSVIDLSQNPPTTSVPDLAFYLFKTVLTRLLTTGSVVAIDSAAPRFREVIEADYAGAIARRLDEVYRSTGSIHTTPRQDKTERETKLNFIVLLNDLDISTGHMERLVRDVQGSPILSQYFMDGEKSLVSAKISSFLTVIPKFRSTLKAGIDQLFNQLIRPRLRNLIPDVYKDVSYVLDEDGYATAEYQDLVRKRFVKAWEVLVDGFKDAFTEANYRSFFGLAIDVILRPWEKYILTLKYTELGAIRFDHDIRVISTYLSTQTVFGDIREKFQRLQQISTLLNIDKEDDVDEFFGSSGISWKLTVTEARTIVGLKV